MPDRPAPATQGTVAVPRQRALRAEEALTFLAGDDRRPLLVLRECLKCSGTEDALMSSTEDNERTYLLARWFQCVRLPPDVLEEEHPFRNLFPGENPAHLFIANHDGSARHDLQGTHSRRELWGAMETAIAANYEDGLASALQRLTRILQDLDQADAALAELETRFELAVSGGDEKKAQKLRTQLGQRRAERAELLAAADKVSRLAPKPLVPASSEG